MCCHPLQQLIRSAMLECWSAVRLVAQGGDRLRQLEALHLGGMQLPAATVDSLAQYTALQELSAGRADKPSPCAWQR